MCRDRNDSCFLRNLVGTIASVKCLPHVFLQRLFPCRLLLIFLMGFAVACNEGVSNADNPLNIQLVGFEALINASTVTTSTVVTANWRGQTYEQPVFADGHVTFSTVFPSDERPVDLRVRLGQADFVVQGWRQPELWWPVAAATPAEVSTVEPADITNLRVELTNWTVSAVGQQSTARASNRHRLGLVVPTELAGIEDRLADSNFAQEPGPTECVCVGGSGASSWDEHVRVSGQHREAGGRR